MVVLIPLQLHYCAYKFEFEKEVYAGLITAVNEFNNMGLHLFLEQLGSLCQKAQVHIEGHFDSGNMRFFFGGALPVYQSVAYVHHIHYLLFIGRLPALRKSM